MTKTLTLKEYELLLKQHDWYYMMSEDQSVYNRGSYSYGNIKELSNASEEHSKMFKEYQNKHKIN